MEHAVTAIGAVAGVCLVLGAGCSACLALVHQRVGGRPRGPAFRVGTGISLAIAHRLPVGISACWLNLLCPLGFLLMAMLRLIAVALGFALLGWARHGSRPLGGVVDELAFWHPEPGLLAHLAGWSMGFVLAVLTTQLILVAEAYRRREQPISRLTGERSQSLFAETVLVDRLGTASRPDLDRRFAELADWLAEVVCGQLRYPTLALARPAGQRSWLKTAVLVLDAGALTEAIAPGWSPASSTHLLTAGIRCLQSVARQYGLVVAPSTVSLQGLEERSFSDMYHYAVRAGLPAQRMEAEAWVTFQRLRTRYAPVAAAISQDLRYEFGDVRLSVRSREPRESRLSREPSPNRPNPKRSSANRPSLNRPSLNRPARIGSPAGEQPGQ